MINDGIRFSRVRLIDEHGDNLGIVDTQRAQTQASEAGLDLVVIAEDSTPPVCKILDYGKFRYEERKRKSQLKKNQKVVQVKEAKVRPVIDEHDFQIKLRKIIGFIGEGHRVRVTLRFRGREIAHQEIGLEVLQRIRSQVEEIARVEQEPSLEGRQMIMVLIGTGHK